MNAYAPPPTRPEPSEAAAQHMRVLRRLVELGMVMAETAAVEYQAARAEPAPKPAEPAAAPQPQPLPPRAAEAVLAFARVSRVVQQSIKLHAILEQDARLSLNPVEHFKDPRRSFLQEAMVDIANLNPDLTFNAAQAYNAIEIRLAKDPAEFATLKTILAAVVEDLGLPPNPKRSDHLIGLFASLSGEEDPNNPDPPDWFIPTEPGPQLE